MSMSEAALCVLSAETDGLGGGAHRIEQAARAIAGRPIPQLPARRRFHRTLLISAGPSPWGRAAVPYRPVRMAGLDEASAKSARLSIR